MSSDFVTTPESRVYWMRELDRCERSFTYFAEHYLRVKSKTAVGFPPLTLNRVQRYLFDRMKAQHKRTGFIRQIWGKARQVGASTLSGSMMLHRTAFRNYYNSFVMSYDEPTAIERFDAMAKFYANLPAPLKPRAEYLSKFKMDFPDRHGRILAGHSRNKNVGAGEMNHFVHMTEAARYPNAQDVQSSFFPTFSEARGVDPSIVIIESTSFYGGEWFKRFAEAARDGKTEFEFHFIPWYMHELYQRPVPSDFTLTAEERHLMEVIPDLTPANIVWWRNERSKYAAEPERFLENFPMTWEESWIIPGGTTRTFEDSTLDYLADHIRPGTRHLATNEGLRRSYGGALEVWEAPQDGVFYDIGIDPAGGHDGDWTALEVVRRDTLEQVAEARGHWNPADEDFLDLVFWTGMIYNRAQLIPDVTGGWGHALLHDLQRRDYPNLWLNRRRDDTTGKISNRAGFCYTKRDKSLLVTNAVQLLKREQPRIHSTALVQEMRDFRTIGLDEWGARTGCHDDLLNAYMLALLSASDDRPRSLTLEDREPTTLAHPDHLFHDIDHELAGTPDMGHAMEWLTGDTAYH